MSSIAHRVLGSDFCFIIIIIIIIINVKINVALSENASRTRYTIKIKLKLRKRVLKKKSFQLSVISYVKSVMILNTKERLK